MELVPLYWLAGISMTDVDVVTRAAALLSRAVTLVRARQAHHKPPFITQIKGAERSR